MSSLKEQLAFYQNEFENFANDFFTNQIDFDLNCFGAEKMLEAMTYSFKNGGKRIRPILCLEFARLNGGNYKNALHSALAVEMIHTYSLIHDDLPCMDDDDIRRGNPSNHIVFGEANALLAGDSLLTIAFEVIALSPLSDKQKVDSVLALSKAAGGNGMIAGQVCDLENEKKQVSLENVIATDKLKTGELITVSALLGCISANAEDSKIKASKTFCRNIGLAFQVIDDILDHEGDATLLGKPTGSDEKNKKSTYVSLLGIDKAREYAACLTNTALESLSIFEDSEFLRELALYLLDRNH